ncbi:lipopolysaccharide biosynthesis protein [Aeromonas rivipollensis]|uniref:lipopolysaccharide biosynthesis protein n=1 Tax=Aeromonas rivipollensis TaxID=948519 RepID=UPI0038D22065
MTKNKSENLIILKNTVISYLRIICTTVFSLLTVRYLIGSLGVERYGIYALITGVITILTFLNSAMTVSTQRYLSFYQGAGDKEQLSVIFKTSCILHFIVGTFLAVILLLLMDPILNNFINIDNVFIGETRCLYLGVVTSIIISIFTVPFNALVISHENFRIDALILIFKSFLMLLISLYMTIISENERLAFLGGAIATISMLTLVLYFLYCKVHYVECTFKTPLLKGVFIDMSVFALWSLYSNICYVLNTQGINVIINKFFGAKMNAAYGIAFQINGQVKNLSQTLLSTMNPQIMKSEGGDNRERTVNVSIMASKVGFFLVALITTPLLYILPDVINIWLGVIPDYVVMFSLFFLFSNLINQLTVGVTPAIQAMGNIKKFQLWIGSTALLVLPISYVMLHFNVPIYSVMCLLLLVELVTGYMKVHIFSEFFEVGRKWYFNKVILKMALPFITTNAVALIFSSHVVFYGSGLFIAVTSVMLYLSSCYIFSLEMNEKMVLNKLMKNLIMKFKGK